jgi:hypothetical protein
MGELFFVDKNSPFWKTKKLMKKCQIIDTAFRSICLFKSGLKILMAIASNLSRSSENGKLVAIGLNLLRWKFIL